MSRRRGARAALRHRAEYTAFALARSLASLLPRAPRDALGHGLGVLAFDVLRVRRRLVQEQLGRAFPEKDQRWIRRTARAAYRHLGREGLELLRLASVESEELIERTRVEGLEELRRALGEGRGAVLASGHLGNWEIGGAMLAVRGIPLDVVAQRQSNPLVDRAVNHVRERLGMRVIERRRAKREVPRALRAGRVVAFVADQDARRSGVFVPFFGRPASTHRGPALLAIRTGSPLFVGTALRERGGGWQGRVRRVEADRSGPLEAVVERLTAAYTALLEEEIGEAPEQYFWLHRRWRTRPRAGEPKPPEMV